MAGVRLLSWHPLVGQQQQKDPPAGLSFLLSFFLEARQKDKGRLCDGGLSIKMAQVSLIDHLTSP